MNPSVPKKYYEVVFPLMEKDGFIKLNSKEYARFNGKDIFQWVSIYVDGQGRRQYRIEYATMLLQSPSDFKVTRIGGKFTKFSSGGSYGAFSEDALNQSIQRVASAYLEEVLPELEKSFSVELYIDRLNEYINDKPQLCGSGHENLELACAYAVLKQYTSARKHACIAKTKYNIRRSEEWANTGFERASLLEAQCDNGKTSVLSEWAQFTSASLKLEKLTNV